jgi:hypothetical protein
MVRIEKAYSGYCTHHEEASQTLQELEKNETVKLWLEVLLQAGNKYLTTRNAKDEASRIQRLGIFIL